MIAEKYIADSLPHLELQDTVKDALELMETFKVSHLPLVDDRNYLRLFSEDELYDLNDQLLLEQISFSFYRPFVYAGQNLLEIFTFLTTSTLSVVPVLNQKNQYLGAIITSDFFFKSLEDLGLGAAGTVLLVKTHKKNFSLTQFSNIIESNSGKLLNFFILKETDDNVLVLIRVVIQEVIPLMQTFERYDYDTEIFTFDDNDYKQMYQKRFEEFLYYLNI